MQWVVDAAFDASTVFLCVKVLLSRNKGSLCVHFEQIVFLSDPDFFPSWNLRCHMWGSLTGTCSSIDLAFVLAKCCMSLGITQDSNGEPSGLAMSIMPSLTLLCVNPHLPKRETIIYVFFYLKKKKFDHLWSYELCKKHTK